MTKYAPPANLSQPNLYETYPEKIKDICLEFEN